MTRKKKIITTVLISLFSVVFLYFFLIIISYSVVSYTVNQLPDLKPQEYLRLKVYGSSSSEIGNTISANCSLINSDGDEIAVIERSWSGSYLALELVEVKMEEKVYVFPSKIYGKNKIKEVDAEKNTGTDLEKYYNYNQHCMLFGDEYSKQDRKNLYTLSSFVINRMPIFNFGQVRRYSVDLSNCKPNRYYSITIDEDGQVIINEI